MAGALSGHLVDSYNANMAARRPTPFTSTSSPLVTSGPMSINPQMHGTSNFTNYSMAESSFSLKSESSFFDSDFSDATTHKIAALQAKLNQKLGPEYISQRPGPGGGPKLTYAEGWKIINLANEVFGFNGWSSNVVSLTIDFIEFNEETRRYTVGTTAIMRVTLRDGVFHEDVGYGMLENSKSKGQALDKVRMRYYGILTQVSELLFLPVQERGCHRWPKAGPAEFREPLGKLSLRQVIYARGNQNQGSSRTFSLSPSTYSGQTHTSSRPDLIRTTFTVAPNSRNVNPPTLQPLPLPPLLPLQIHHLT